MRTTPFDALRLHPATQLTTLNDRGGWLADGLLLDHLAGKQTRNGWRIRGRQ
jgi:hypothetical protein